MTWICILYLKRIFAFATEYWTHCYFAIIRRKNKNNFALNKIMERKNPSPRLHSERVRCLSTASLPLSGRLVTCPWYWEYHWVEFSVPASGQNLELSVPTHLVLTVCKEKPLICIRMQGKRPFVAQTVFKPKPQKHFSKAYCSHEPVLLRRKMGK